MKEKSVTFTKGKGKFPGGGWLFCGEFRSLLSE